MKKTYNKSDRQNPLPSDMITIAELRAFPGFEKISDEEATETITSLYQLSQLAYQVFVEEHKLKSCKTDNKEEVS